MSRLWPLKYPHFATGARSAAGGCAACATALRRFGQADHVRLYGTDLRDRIAAAGRDARVEHLGERLTPEQVRRHRLIPAGGSPDDPSFTDVYVGAKSGPGTPRRPS